MATKAQIVAAVTTFAAKTDPALNTNASNIVDFIQACGDAGVDVVGEGLEGLCIRSGQVWFHSTDGKPTGVPTIARVKNVLDAEAVARLVAALNAKFNP